MCSKLINIIKTQPTLEFYFKGDIKIIESHFFQEQKDKDKKKKETHTTFYSTMGT